MANASDATELRTLQESLRVYQGLLTAAINRKDTANVILGLTQQRDAIKMQIADVSARLKLADDPSVIGAKLEEGANQLLAIGNWGAWMVPVGLGVAALYFLAQGRRATR